MRNERHTRSYRGILAVCGGDNDCVKSERHCNRTYCAYNVVCRDAQGKYRKYTYCYKREYNKSEYAYSVNGRLFKGLLNVDLGNSKSCEYHRDR